MRRHQSKDILTPRHELHRLCHRMIHHRVAFTAKDLSKKTSMMTFGDGEGDTNTNPFCCQRVCVFPVGFLGK